MRTDKIRKYLIPNIPYLFILWAFLKLGTAYRLAAGNDFAHKLIGLGQTIGPAFADFAPGLVPLDWLVGIVGAVGFRLLIYFKSKNAKKFRRDAEYGSARWGTEKDIKPFVDPRFENNVILTGTEFLTMNTRPKIPANARNLNCCIIGSSGSGKTRFWLTPQLLQAHSSYVVVDPKGGVLGQVGGFLQKRGYKIKVFNSIDFSKSMHYNPLAYIRNEADILKFVDALISNTKGEGKEGDPFWTKSETLLYCALIAYIIFEGPAEDRNMNTLVDMISGMEVKEDDEDFMNAVDYMFAGLEKAAEERQRRMERIKRRKAQGLQDRYLYDYTFANDNGQNPLMDKARAYVENWKEAYKSNIGLLLFGDVGTGKSFFAGCIANALLDQDVPVLMTNFPTILNRLTRMFSEDRSEFIASFDEYDLLIIDDLGVERSTEYAMEQMFFVIDSRYRSRRPMIITTNLKLSELKNPPDLAHARIYDRILERCAPILFDGKNFREENAGATRQAAKDIVNSKQD